VGYWDTVVQAFFGRAVERHSHLDIMVVVGRPRQNSDQSLVAARVRVADKRRSGNVVRAPPQTIT
jgi:hypothetical protein